MATLAELAILLTAKDAASSVFRKVQGEADKTGSSFLKLGATAAAGLVAAGAGIGVFAAKAISMASDMDESQNKVNVVFGESSKVINDFAKNAAQSLGQSQQQALAAAGTFGNLFVSMGLGQGEAAKLSTEIVTLGSDLASFNNIKPEEALDKLRAGLVGETEPLRALGVNLNAAAVEEEALRLGLAKSKGEITDAIKVQARYSLILQQTKTAQGDFSRTSTGMANSMRIISASFADITTQIGSRLLPIVAPLISKFAQALPKALDFTVRAIDNVAKSEFAASILAGVGQVLGAFKGLPSAIGSVAEAIRTIATGDFRGGIFGIMEDSPVVGALFAIRAGALGVAAGFTKVFPVVLGIGKQFVALAKFIGIAVTGGEDINGEFKKLSPVFQIVGSVIDKVIRNLQMFARAGLEVLHFFAPIGRMLGDIALKLFDFAFGVRDTSKHVGAMAAPLEIVAGLIAGFIALLAVGKLFAFTGEMLGLAKSIVTFPLKPLIDAGKGVADFVTETGKLASKVVTVTADVVTKGFDALKDLFSDKTQTVKRNIETKDDRAFDDFHDRTQTVTRKVKTEVDEPDEAAAKSFASKISSLIGSAIGPAIGSAIGGALIAVAAGVSFVALLPAVIVGATVLAAAFGAFLIVKFKDEFFRGIGAVGAVIVEGLSGLADVVALPGKLIDAAFRLVFETTVDTVTTVLGALPGIIGSVFADVLSSVSRFGTDLQADFVGTIKNALEAGTVFFRDLPINIGLALVDASKSIADWVTDSFNIFKGFTPWEWIKDAVADATKNLRIGFEGMTRLIQGVLDFIARLRGEAAKPVTGAATSALPSVARDLGEGETVLGIRIAEPPLGEARLVTRQVFEAMQREAEGFELPVPTLAPIQPITVPAPILANFQAGLNEAQFFSGGAMAAIAGALSNIPDLPIPDASGFIALFAKSRRSVEGIVDQMSTNVAQTFEDTVNSGIEVFSELARFFANDFVSGIRSGVSRTTDALDSLVTGFRDVFNQVISTIVNFIGQAMGAFGQLRPWDAVSGAFATLISNVGSSLGGFLDLIGNAVAEAGNLWDQLTQPQAPVFQPIPQPAPPFVPTPTPPPYEQPPDTGQDGFQTSPGQYKVVPGAPNQPKFIMAHGGEVIGRPFKNMMRGLKSYQTEEGEFKEIDGPLGASVPILAHGGEAIMPMSESRERVATVGFGDKQVISPFDRAQQTIFEIVNSIVQASHTLGSALEEQAGQILGHLLQTRFGGFIDSVVGIVRSKDVLAGDENLFDPSKAIRSWDETLSEFMYRHDLGHIVGPDDRIFEDEFYRELTDLISQSSGKVSSYQSLDPITVQHESVSRELAAKLSASGSLFPTEVAARILGFTGSPESKGEETSKLGIREVFQNPQGEFWTRFGGSIEQPPPGFEFSYPEHFGVGIREAFQNALGDFWTRPLGNSEEPPHGFELAYPETFATAVREVFKNALDEFWTRPVGSEQEPPAGFKFAYPESYQTRPGEAKQVPGASWQPRIAMVHGGEVISRPMEAMASQVLDSYKAAIAQPKITPSLEPVMASGQDLITRPINVGSGLLPSSSSVSNGGVNVTLNMGGVTVTNEADEQRLAQTIEQRLLDSLERLLGQGTPFPHGLNMRT